VSGSAVADVDGSSNAIQFDLENTGSSAVTIDAIKINSTNTSADIVAETNSGNDETSKEVYVDADTDGDYEAGDSGGSKLFIGNQETLSNASTINAGNQGTVYVYEFQENSGTLVNMEDSRVTVTIFYGDGSKDTFTLDVPSP